MTRGFLIVAAVATLAGCWSVPGGYPTLRDPETAGQLPPEEAYDARKLGTRIDWIAEPEIAARAAEVRGRLQLVLHLSGDFAAFEST